MSLKVINKNIFLVPDFLTPIECREYIEMSEKLGYEKALVETEKGYQEIKAVRDNDRVLFTDSNLSSHLYERAFQYLPGHIGNSSLYGLNELIRFYRYKPGQKFKKHNDQSFIKNEEEASYYTFLIYLNDNYEGGETQFDMQTIRPQAGTLLIFLHQLEHSGNEVVNGVKYVLRTDVMYKLNK
ncbi:MAG TPA: 2OG-Fe(II) oxygenase [Bacteroidia bacterium]|nr:2OG-Fe(II) oxygenase [Bacteroidia bacterium]